MNNHGYWKKMENYILVSWLDETNLCSKTVIMATLVDTKSTDDITSLFRRRIVKTEHVLENGYHVKRKLQ